jgi:hypothetical protein
MNRRKRKTRRVSLHYWGRTVDTLWFAVAGEAFVLTSPFIERDSRNVGAGPKAGFRKDDLSRLG